jgi:hypothetical protein
MRGARMDGEVRALPRKATAGGEGGARSVGEWGEASGGHDGI